MSQIDFFEICRKIFKMFDFWWDFLLIFQLLKCTIILYSLTEIKRCYAISGSASFICVLCIPYGFMYTLCYIIKEADLSLIITYDSRKHFLIVNFCLLCFGFILILLNELSFLNRKSGFRMPVSINK